MKRNLILLLNSIFLLSACSQFNRSPESGYADPNRRAYTVKRTTRSSVGMDDREEENVSQKTRLKQLENSLSTRKETEQYSKALPWFANEEERMDFLRQPGFEARQKWMTERNFSARSGEVQNSMRELVEAQDIAVGMPQALVRKAWGDPDSVEVSGNPQFRNERWHYNKFVSTQEGYRPEKKTVYFEGGKVVAWELD